MRHCVGLSGLWWWESTLQTTFMLVYVFCCTSEIRVPWWNLAQIHLLGNCAHTHMLELYYRFLTSRVALVIENKICTYSCRWNHPCVFVPPLPTEPHKCHTLERWNTISGRKEHFLVKLNDNICQHWGLKPVIHANLWRGDQAQLLKKSHKVKLE